MLDDFKVSSIESLKAVQVRDVLESVFSKIDNISHNVDGDAAIFVDEEFPDILVSLIQQLQVKLDFRVVNFSVSHKDDSIVIRVVIPEPTGDLDLGINLNMFDLISKLKNYAGTIEFVDSGEQVVFQINLPAVESIGR